MSAVCQVQAFTSKAAVVTRQPRGRVVRVAAVQQQEVAPAAPLRFLAAGLAAAAVATCGSPAEAGVVLVQPEVKNFVNNTAPAPREKEAAAPKAAKQAAAKQAEEPSAPGGGFESFRPFVFPVSLLAVAGAGIAATKADPEFARLFDETWSAKDSIRTGAGYETAPGMKDGPMFGGSAAPKAAPKKSTGTKKVAAKAAAGTAKKSVLGSIFGSRD